MSTETSIVTTSPGMTPDQIDLIKKTVARGCTDDEFKLFLHACRKTGLDPLMKQIYAVKRGNSMAIQTGIDGFRLIGERTGKYAPGREPSFTYDENGKIVQATSYIKKMTPDGTWHEVAASARFDEYCPGSQFWQKMPHVMIAKVAEALALRRAFPMELSGIYSTEEMTQADAEQAAQEKFPQLRERGVKAVSDVVEEEPAAVEEEGSGESGEVGRADPPDDDAVKRKLRLEAEINKQAAKRGVKPSRLRDETKEKILDHFKKEHLVDLTPTECAKVMFWLATKD